MKNPGLNGKLATQDYVDFKGDTSDRLTKVTKPNVQMPYHNPTLKTPAQKKGYAEDEGKM